MAPEDEAAFLAFVFKRPTVHLIPEVRNPTSDVPHTRDSGATRSMHCMLWDKAILARPDVEYIPACNDYYLRSDESLIQFLRSPVRDGSIEAGRLALATAPRGAPDTDPTTAKAMSAWFTSLRKWVKTNFENTFVYASDFKPDVGSRERTVWVGPTAIALSKQGWKLKLFGPREYSLHYFDPSDEERVLSRYRAPKNIIGTGRVLRVGEIVSTMTGKRIFQIAFDEDAPFSQFEGPFTCFGSEPKLGDEVACVFNENIFGRRAEPWESRELKRLTPANRERVIAGLRKAWRV